MPARCAASRPIGDLHTVVEGRFERERSALQSIRQRLALEVLHDQVIDTALVAHVMQRAKVRMVELRDRLRLPLEASLALGTLGKVFGKNFDGHRPVESCIRRFVDFPQTARTNGCRDLVGSEARSES